MKKKPQVTKEIKDQAKKVNELKWDSKTESMYDYVERMSKLKKENK